MSSINFHTKEISVKIVYYGPGLCGKTTSLQTIYASLPESNRPKLVSLATDVDRTIFFDFLPLAAYRIRDFVVRLQLYTVPGQVFYNATRKLVLNGVDGIVFVADSQRAMRDSNLESLQNLGENLSELGLELGNVPMVMQFNKRDLPDVFSVQEMDRRLNTLGVPVFATVAVTGEGLLEALKAISQKVVNDLMRKGLGRQLSEHQQAAEGSTPAPPKVPAGGVSGFANVAEAVARVTQTHLWPNEEVAGPGAAITDAISQGNWTSVVTLVGELLSRQAQQWADSQAGPTAPDVASFLFWRRVLPDRYRAFLQDVTRAQAGQTVEKSGALNALILALEAVW